MYLLELMLLLFRDKWPAEREQPDLLAGTHIRFGILVMQEDVRKDSHYAQQEANHSGVEH